MKKNKELYFREIYTQSKDKIYRLCLGFVGNKVDADDLFQEITIKIWNHLDSFRNESSINTWIYRIATNTALLYVKTRHKSSQLQSNLPIEKLNISSPDSEYLEQENKLVRLYSAISSLKEMDRIIMSLLLEGNSYADIATITGLNVSNVGVRINRIKKLLSKKMNQS